MEWTIEYPYKDVEQFILELPSGLSARYIRLTDLMLEFGSNLGMPHTQAMSDGLFELRVKGKEGIARVFYCTLVGKRIVILHGFVKKSQKTPKKELHIAKCRLAEVKNNESQ
jgi:phage-related protein